LRLPHTPRSFPQAAAAHYFDDVFSNKKRTNSTPQLRRSSTTRSIGNRDSVASASVAGDANGTENGNGDYSEDAIPDVRPDPASDSAATRSQLEHDEHVQRYVNDQLHRVQSGGSADHVHDEFEATLDGA